MVARRRSIGQAAALLVAACAAGAGASSADLPVAGPWAADPDAQFLLEVRLRNYRLGEGVRAWSTPEGTCLLFGDVREALDLPITVDVAAGTATGWAFSEQRKIVIDTARRAASFGAESETLAPGTVRETPDGWCIDSAAFSRWLGVSLKPMTSGSVLVVESREKLPVELAMDRERRAERLKIPKFDIAKLPQVRLPYRMWRAPALDFVVSAGVTYRASDGVQVDRRTSIYAAGEIAKLSYDAQLATNDQGRPSALRLRAFRSDPKGGLLGPLGATHVGAGDVAGLDSRLSGSSASGRGAVLTNRPLLSPTVFDRSRFEGDLPDGWDAEIYRNGELLGFARPSGDRRYVFEDVQLQYGENRVSVVLYGPQGQVRTREEVINVGQDQVPAGKTWYWAGFNQPGRDLVSLDRLAEDPSRPKIQAAVAFEHGLDSRTSLGVLARTMLLEDERVTFVEGSIRRAVGPALVEVAAARTNQGGTAARAQVLAKIGNLNLAAEALLANDFHLRGSRESSIRDYRVAADLPLRIGRAVLPARAALGLRENADGTRQLEAAARLAGRIDRFNLATDLRYRRQYATSGPAPPPELEWSLMGSGRVGPVRLRGFGSYDLAPEPRFRSAELSAYWSASDRVDWEGALAYDAPAKRARARLTHVRRFESLSVALTGEAATDGSAALGLNLNFSLDSGHGFRPSRQPLASAGAVRARVYRDLNDNGVRDHSEPLEEGALVTTGTRLSEKPTDKSGAVLIGGLSAFAPVTVGIDQSSLKDPLLVPKKALQVVVPRPGIPADVEIGLVGAGEVEGAIVKSGGIGFEGLDLELIDGAGKTIATARTDYDGFFLFERVPYGRYTLRVATASATIAKIVADTGVAAAVSPEKPVARLGSVAVVPLPQLASIQ